MVIGCGLEQLFLPSIVQWLVVECSKENWQSFIVGNGTYECISVIVVHQLVSLVPRSSRPSVACSTNAGVRRPGYEGTNWLGLALEKKMTTKYD